MICATFGLAKDVQLNWSSLVLFLLLSLLALWAAYSFLNKLGLYLFSILAIVLSFVLPEAIVFNDNILIPMFVIFMPLIYFSLIVMAEKYSKVDGERMFLVLLFTMFAMFLFEFLTSAYIDSAIQMGVYLTWRYLGRYVSTILAFTIATLVSNAFKGTFPVKNDKKYLRRALIVSIACLIHTVFYSAFAYIGVGTAFVNVVYIILIDLAIMTCVSFLVAFLRKFLNRRPSVTIEEVDKEMQKEEKEQQILQETDFTKLKANKTEKNNKKRQPRKNNKKGKNLQNKGRT